MNIIIPLGGKGKRFKDKNFLVSKPLIKIFDKEMIFYVLDNLKIQKNDKIFIIYYNLHTHNFQNLILSKYPEINFIELNKQTSGAAETIYYGLKEILNMTLNKKCVLLDCDTFYTDDVLNIYRSINSNAIFYIHNDDINPIYSYIELNENNNITKVKEKIKISDNANTGIYCFKDVNELYKYAKYIVENKIMFNNECYTTCIIDKMISDSHNFTGIKLDKKYVFNLGTPEQLNEYIKNTYLFLFDLDGTLITTDEIYFDVWKTILINYKINLTEDIFKNCIQGNSDNVALKKIIPSKCNKLLEDIPNIKDALFLKNIDKMKIINGSIEFINIVKKMGHKIAIVTNCNRSSAEKIINNINISGIIDILIIANECSKTKPHPDPYLKAINYFNSNNTRAIIFEDSKTGIQSGKNTFPKCLVGIETIYNTEELLNNGVNISIKNYVDFDIDKLFTHNNMGIEKIKNYIINSIQDINIIKIDILNHKLKGGFICDVIGVKIHTEDKILECVLKLEIKNETFLSNMAHELGLYEREYYFYNDIIKYVPIKTPLFHGLIKDEYFNNVGILMENLVDKNYKLNLNLNEEKIDVSLKIIENLAKLHSKFWNKNLENNFKELKKHNNPMFNPKWSIFVKDNWIKFKTKWSFILNTEQIQKANEIVNDFQNIQNKLSDTNLTLCHGDVKSANIFYKPIENGYEPYFIDWQYITEGKGVQDLVFFMIESFEIDVINKYKNIFKEYYYIKLLEYGVNNYDKTDYDNDFDNSIKYFPFFVAIWFGTIDEDELIDKNFPFFFIQRLFNFIK
jgi:beta-phosphoglucomutase-like phosphatase (HAD superfamily)/molybdopterin-guanine dinucleotide biosynthesis protein A